ncbi:MAG: hypothetical protein MZV63_65695 [Marinilabiliales bacterium]|nr:hypothetical protein [Marinilabiliales bacterium]
MAVMLVALPLTAAGQLLPDEDWPASPSTSSRSGGLVVAHGRRPRQLHRRAGEHHPPQARARAIGRDAARGGARTQVGRGDHRRRR